MDWLHNTHAGFAPLSLCITSCVCCWFWHQGYWEGALVWWEVGFLPICHLEQFASCWFSRPVSEPRLNVCCRLFSNKTPSLVFTSSSSSSPYILKTIKSADCAFQFQKICGKKCLNCNKKFRNRSAQIIINHKKWCQWGIFVENILCFNAFIDKLKGLFTIFLSIVQISYFG